MVIGQHDQTYRCDTEHLRGIFITMTVLLEGERLKVNEPSKNVDL
jgi:hypothetical protein